MIYSCDDGNDLFHAFLTLTCPSPYDVDILQYVNNIAIHQVQYIDTAKHNIVKHLHKGYS